MFDVFRKKLSKRGDINPFLEDIIKDISSIKNGNIIAEMRDLPKSSRFNGRCVKLKDGSYTLIENDDFDSNKNEENNNSKEEEKDNE